MKFSHKYYLCKNVRNTTKLWYNNIFIDAGLRSIFSLAYKAGINLFVDYLSEKPDVNLLLINPWV